MSFFFLFFFASYGGMHYYLFHRLREAFHPSLWFLAAAAVFFALMVSTPTFVHLAARREYHLTARLLAYFGYGWMGLIFFFFFLSLLVDAWHLLLFLIRLLARMDGGVAAWRLSARAAFFVPLSLACCLFVWGIYEATHIKVESIVLESDKIPPTPGRLRIVQISDLHIGLIVRGERLKKITDAVEEAKPDILVSTGDLVDGLSDSLEREYKYFQGIRPPLGKYAITGNHEFYAGLDRALAFTRQAGFVLLRNEVITLPGLINLAGMDDQVVRNDTAAADVSAKKILERLPRDKFTLFLLHRPLVEPQALGMFDLQLSGHTHKGQMFPFTLVTRLFFPRQAGLYRLSAGSALYVNRGAGTWGPPLRFLSPPEITVIDLVHRK